MLHVNPSIVKSLFKLHDRLIASTAHLFNLIVDTSILRFARKKKKDICFVIYLCCFAWIKYVVGSVNWSGRIYLKICFFQTNKTCRGQLIVTFPCCEQWIYRKLVKHFFFQCDIWPYLLYIYIHLSSIICCNFAWNFIGKSFQWSNVNKSPRKKNMNKSVAISLPNSIVWFFFFFLYHFAFVIVIESI